MNGVELEITPQPSPEEQAAIAAAVAEMLREKDDRSSPWWQAGLPDDADGSADGADQDCP